MIESRSILVSGGGIAGLTTALALSKRGYRVDVLEKAENFDPIGAGIQLSPNAVRVLDSLGISSAIRMTATVPDGIKIRVALTNRVIATVPLGVAAIANYGVPYLCLHRSDLHQALQTACEGDPDINLATGSEVTDATIHPNGISALVNHHGRISTRRAQMLVIADGARSRLRDQMGEDHQLVHGGFEAWRAMVPAASLPAWVDLDYTHLILGRNAHAVLYPVHGKRYLNIVVCLKSRDRDLTNQPIGDRDVLLKRTLFWSRKLRALFRLTEDWSVWPILERPKASFWEGGPVALVGDAAHAMTPFAAQGAAMAIEDAEVLAKSIEAGGITPDAVKAYGKAREKRTTRVRKLTKTNGQLYHMGWPFSVFRNIGLELMPKKRLLTRQSWIYNWRA